MNGALGKRLSVWRFLLAGDRQPGPAPEGRPARLSRGTMAAAATTAATAATALAASGAAAIAPDLTTTRPGQATTTPAAPRATSATGLPALPGRWRLVARNGVSTEYRVIEHQGALYVCDGCRMSLARPLRGLEGEWIPLDVHDR